MSTNSTSLLTIAYLPATHNGLSYRGSEVALYDYADYAEKLLGHKSIICLEKIAYNEPLVLEKFKKRFNNIIYFNSPDDLESQLLEHNVNALYSIRATPNSGLFMKKIPMLIHCVYCMNKTDDLPGIITAGVSQSIASASKRIEYVPHMVSIYDTTEDYRSLLGIPNTAKVFGRHGGRDTWDLQMAKEALLRVLSNTSDIYFLFAVRPHNLTNISHPRLICLEAFADPQIKRKFVNTCNAMIHAQSLGEAMGLSIMEFSQANKPIITYNGGKYQEHLRILGDKCIKYNNADELYNILTMFDPPSRNWKAYTDYTPDKIMAQFDKVFLDPLRSFYINR